MTTLSELIRMNDNVYNKLAENGGEITSELNSLIETLDIKLPAKIDGYMDYLDMLERIEADAKQKADYFAHVKKSSQNAYNRLWDHLKHVMESNGLTELEGNRVRFTLSNSAPKLDINEDAVPDEFKIVVTSTEVDKERVRRALSDGLNILGAKFIRVTRLLMKRK